MRHLMITTILAALPLGALAEDAALVLGMERYEQLGRLSRGDDVVAAAQGLESLGFAVTALANGRADTTLAALAGFVDAAEDAERLVVVMSGRFVSDGSRTWLLTADAASPSLLSLGDRAVSVDSVLHILARAQGRAVLLIGAEADDGTEIDDTYLAAGIGTLDIPQGVSVLRAAPADAAAFLAEELSAPEADLAVLIAANPRVQAAGFVPATWVLMPAEITVEPADPLGTPVVDTSAEDALWEGTIALDTVDAYRTYLRRFPDGQYTEIAETTIAEILAEPNRADRLAEEGLSLTREARREIQRDLTALDYNTRGVDGIFGPGSRSAIRNWQQQNGYPQTSYLTTEQISRLDAQAERRAAELAAEAERERLAQARLDRAFWDETGARGDEPGYRAYLGRYPEGQFAALARQRLAAIEGEREAATVALDRAAWDRALSTETVAGFQAYLAAYPEGAFKAEAEARIAALTAPDEDTAAIDAARAQEEALGLPQIRAQLVELRLREMGLNPGAVDGEFDEDTRSALRAYQENAGLGVTGYLDQATAVQLLADSFGIRIERQ
ncbi:peptidoglycan-binding domain-containing protein [Octadecabacter sp. R77987]|uniref:peptidoglycan-binding domain-containing protein n=1 Tax=Octadecabacter sp. R77987 TaxID=3093874 RepID=UPI003670B662